MSVILAFVAVFVIVLFVPLPVYMLFTKVAGLEEPENPSEFFGSVVVQKIGTTVGFVFFFYFAIDVFATSWLGYALIWFAMYAIIEIGQAIGPHYSWKEAFAGIIAEFIYFPLAGFVMLQILV